MIKIIVAGANGRMGQEVVKMIKKENHFSLVSGVSPSLTGIDIGKAIGIGYLDIPFRASVKEALSQHKADVLVDFTTPLSVRENAEIAIEAGVRPVVGTSGLTDDDIIYLDNLCKKKKLGGIFAPNFAIGAVLMMAFSSKAAKYLPYVEIIESHHNEKLDAPSGTACKTADLIAKNRSSIKQGHPHEMEILEGARGASLKDIRIHSIRLPGLLAHQKVLLGGEGEILTLQHDSLNRESFMPGVKLAIEKVFKLNHLVYGLENILDI